MSKNRDAFTKPLIYWYLQNKRDLPWRNTKNPYTIWLSEIILQQTRVAQGLPYFQKFLNTFPTVFDLAKAPESQVLKLWQGLGYYSRARNLHFTAKYIVENYNGVFPKTHKELLKLKGVGDYTASAIASICYNEPDAVVDGNVYRVLSRFFGVDLPVNSTEGIKYFKKLAQTLLDPKQSGTFNQAMMEFGARYCVPSHPDCTNCIFKTNCLAFAKNKVSVLPLKIKKTKVKDHYFHFLVCLSEDHKTLFEQRTEKGIWQNLFQFPLIDFPQSLKLEELKNQKKYKNIENNYKVHATALFNEKPILHKLSHKNLYVHFWILETGNLGKKGVSIQNIESFAVPIVLGNFISTFSVFKN